MEDEAYLVQPQVSKLVAVELEHVFAVHCNCSFVRAGQTAKKVKKRRFATARWSENAEELALFNVEGYASQGGNGDFAEVEGFFKVGYFQNWCRHACHLPCRQLD